MPVYSYFDPKKKEQFDVTMTTDEMIQYEKDNPKLERIYKMNVVDSVRIGVTKPPADFSKHVLGKIKNAHPRGSVEKRWSIPKEL